MNSMAQQAVPNGIGQMEDLRPHFTNASRVVVMMSPPPWTDGYRVGSSILPRKMSSKPMESPHHIGGAEGRARGGDAWRERSSRVSRPGITWQLGPKMTQTTSREPRGTRFSLAEEVQRPSAEATSRDPTDNHPSPVACYPACVYAV